METRCGVAHSTLLDSFDAGVEMTREAINRAGIMSCSFALVFASVQHNIEKLREGVQSITGREAMIIGTTAPGILTNDFLSYDGILAGIMVIESDRLSFDFSLAPYLKRGEYEGGKELGRNLNPMLSVENPNLLLFYDGVIKKEGVKRGLNWFQAKPILDGIRSEIGHWPPAAGIGVIDFPITRNCRIWDNESITQESILALIISGKVKMSTTIMHGCKPASDYHTFTKLRENLLLEIDHRPAQEIVVEYMGNPEEIDWRLATTFITLGVNKGEKYGPFKEENYVNRMVTGIDEETGGLILGESDLREGDEFQFMRRSIETDMVGEEARKLLASNSGHKPLFAIYISCLGRVKKLYGSENEEGEEVQEALGDIPLLGIYSGVEIASVKGELMPLDWTGVLCLFSEI